MLITFSGLDGSGKTTLIVATRRLLEARGWTVTVCSMYDDITVYALVRGLRDRVRALLGAGGHAGDTTEAGAEKTVRPGMSRGPARLVYATARHPATRACVLPLDVVIFACRSLYEQRVRGRVLVMDRYFYDSLADLAGAGRLSWLYIAVALRFLPRPAAPIYVDVAAETAYRRKPEYPLAYMRWRRTVYERIFARLSAPIVLENYDREATIGRLEQILDDRLGGRPASRGLATWNGSGAKR